MPSKTQKIEKIFYSIGEVAQILGVNTSLIRYWEKNFTILKPKKNKKGNRMFTQADVDNLRIIYHLVKEQRMTIEGARLKLQEGQASHDALVEKAQVLDSLQNIRKMLVDIQKELG